MNYASNSQVTLHERVNKLNGEVKQMSEAHKDNRRVPLGRDALAKNTDSNVFKTMKSIGMPVTIADLTKAIDSVNERTIRRSVDRLKKTGFIIEGAQRNNAQLYMLDGTSAYDDSNSNGKLIPFGSGSKTVEEFVRLMIDVESNPFKTELKQDIFDDEFVTILRKRMLTAVITAGEPGFNSKLKDVQMRLLKIQREIDSFALIVESFNNGPVWYDQYRDRIAYAVGELRRNSPDLFAMVITYLQNKESE